MLSALLLLLATGSASRTCADRVPIAAPQWQVRCTARLEEARAQAARKDPSLAVVPVAMTFFGYETRISAGEGGPITVEIRAQDGHRNDEQTTPWTQGREEDLETATRLMKGRFAAIRSSSARSAQVASFSAAFRSALDDCLAMPEWEGSGLEGRMGAAEYRAELLSFLWNARYDPDADRPRDGSGMLKYLLVEAGSLRGDVEALLAETDPASPSLGRMRALQGRVAQLREEIDRSSQPGAGSQPELEAGLARALAAKDCRQASIALHWLAARGHPSESDEESRLFDLERCYSDRSRPYRACAVARRLAGRHPNGKHVAEAHLECGTAAELMCQDDSAELEYRSALKVSSQGSWVAALAEQRLKALEARRGKGAPR